MGSWLSARDLAVFTDKTEAHINCLAFAPASFG